MIRARCAILALVLLSLPSIARANYAFQGIVSVSGGWTSNAAAAAAGTPGADPDALITVSPSVVFTSSLARAVQRLSYNFSSVFYPRHSALSAISNRLDWNGLFTPSRTTSLQLTAYALQSQLNSTTVDTGTQLTRVGTQNYFGAGVTEQLMWDWSPQGRLTEALSATAFIPSTSALGQSWLTSGSLGLARIFRRDSLGGDFTLGYNNYQATHGPTNNDGNVNPDGVVTPTQQQISASLLGRWRHDFERFWNINLGAGAATLFRASDGGGRIWQPVGEAGVHFLHPRGQLDLSYTRALMPNPIVQSTFVGDTVSLHASVPFGEKSHLTFIGGGSYVHYQAANTFSGSTGTRVDLFLVDATLNWLPFDWLAIFTRYTYQNQLADASQNPPVATIERHLVVVGLTVTYPPQGAANLPTHAAIRVDGSDAVTIPDLHRPPPEK